MSIQTTNPQEFAFINSLNELGFIITDIEKDGNCLFRAVSHQLYGNQNAHMIIRQKCCEYIQKEREFFSNYAFDESLEKRLTRMNKEGTWADNLEIQALSEIYQTTIEIYYLKSTPVIIYSNSSNNEKPIRLYYRNLCHYDSITDTDTFTKMENVYILLRQNSLDKKNNETMKVNRLNMRNYFESTVDQLINKSIDSLKFDEKRQQTTVIKESESLAIEEDIIKMTVAESIKIKINSETNHRADQVLGGRVKISASEYGIYKFLLGLGYSMGVALQAQMKFGPREGSVEVTEILDFIHLK